MDGKREMASSFSFSADLLGTKKSPSSSTGIFASILSPPLTAEGKNSSNSEVRGTWQEQPLENETWNNKQGTPALYTEIASSNIPNEDMSSIFQEERAEPCHLSSSLYYGGQDIYSRSPGTYAAPYPILKKDGGEDNSNENNSHGASRGNWWQGSLYY